MFEDLLANLFTLGMLVLLQAVLGFDNLLYISIESKRVERQQQSMVRKWGIGLAILLRVALLFAVLAAKEKLQTPFLTIPWEGVIHAEFDVYSMIVLAGGAFIIYTATKEIYHMLSVEHIEGSGQEGTRSVASAIFWIVLMNLVFSFDSILSAVALTDVPWVIIVAIVISGIMMIYLANTVSEFLKKNRMYEVLGLFVLFIVGVMLVSEGGHLAHLKLWGHPVEAMSKSTFYFVLAVLVIVDVVQARYQKKLLAQKHIEVHGAEAS